MTEQSRLRAHYAGEENWLFWGPYLSERQWGTVREDYSENGDAWNYFPHDHARSRVYRWGEDGLAGFSDEKQRLCFGLALWNEQDPILKERLFGLTGPEGNHGEDVKELYYYMDATPSHSYLEFLYKYPHAAYPYDEIVAENGNRNKLEREYELLDTGVFDDGNYFDVEVRYARAAWNDLCIEITVHNRGEKEAPIWVLPQLWFRNTWAFDEDCEKPTLRKMRGKKGLGMVEVRHPELGIYYFQTEASDQYWFTENETNNERIFDTPNASPFVKDAFHTALIEGETAFLKGKTDGTKCAPVYRRMVPGKGSVSIKIRLSQEVAADPLGKDFIQALQRRKEEADAFFGSLMGEGMDSEQQKVFRQALAGMMWTKMFYHFDVPRWLEGDSPDFQPPQSRKEGRNSEWHHLNNADIISMPDKWEYPWYAVWDLAFHCVTLALMDVQFAKDQLLLVLREWYMHPNGQIPAYEWNFSDVNPPVHAWATLEVFRYEKEKTGKKDLAFLKRIFHKLLLNFTWWVNRKDVNGNNIFEGGFLGLDNIGVFDRSAHLPGGGHLEQADGTAWMASYCLQMLHMALEISMEDPTYEDLATKFFEHFTYITETLNHLHDDEHGMWDEEEGFYFDKLILPDGRQFPVKVRSLVGLAPLFAVTVITKELQEKVPEFTRRLHWFRDYRLSKGKEAIVEEKANGDLLLALVPRQRLERLLLAMFDEEEFLAPGGIRSLSKRHLEQPFSLQISGEAYGLSYQPAESDTLMFGGNSNWRGPVWFPMNYLLIRALDTYHDFFEELCLIGLPDSIGRTCSLSEIGDNIAERLVGMFMPNEEGQRPIHLDHTHYQKDPHFKELVLFYEYFDGDTSRGVGATHQTGWTGLVANLILRLKGEEG